MTPQESRTLDIMREHISQHGHAPGFEELALHLGIRSKGAAHRLVEKLVARGMLVRSGGPGTGIKTSYDLPERQHVQTAPSQALWDELRRRGEVRDAA